MREHVTAEERVEEFRALLIPEANHETTMRELNRRCRETPPACRLRWDALDARNRAKANAKVRAKRLDWLRRWFVREGIDINDMLARRCESTANAALTGGVLAVPSNGVVRCLWTVDDDGVWNTSCGQAHVFEAGTPGQNEFSFCPYCGKPMSECHTPNAPGQARAGSPSPEAGCSVPAAIAEAVAAVYFDDSADYRRALLNVVRHLDAAAYDMTLIDTAKAYRRYCEPNHSSPT